MPKGVEHCRIHDCIRATRRVESLMPKGVEHLVQAKLTMFNGLRVESLMPKGVEHIQEGQKNGIPDLVLNL